MTNTINNTTTTNNTTAAISAAYQSIIDAVRAAQADFTGCDWTHYFSADDAQIDTADAHGFDDAEEALEAWIKAERKENEDCEGGYEYTREEVLEKYDTSEWSLETAFQKMIDYLASAREAAKTASDCGGEIIELCEAGSDDFAEMLELAEKAKDAEGEFGDSPTWGRLNIVIVDAMLAETSLDYSDVEDETYGRGDLIAAIANGDLTAAQSDILIRIRRSAFGEYLLDSGDYMVRGWSQADVDLLEECEAIVVCDVSDNGFYGSLVTKNGTVDAHSWRSGAQTHSPKSYLQDYGFESGAKIGDITFSYWDGEFGCSIDDAPFVIEYTEDDEDDQLEITNSWAQLGGGTRYLITGVDGEITVDADEDGKLSGFARPGFSGDEDEALEKAFALVNSINDDE